MKYMLMMHAPKATGNYAETNWSPEDFKAHIAFMPARISTAPGPGGRRLNMNVEVRQVMSRSLKS